MKTTPVPSRLASRRGSVLIVALMLCAVIGISIASYLQLSRTNMAISNRALYNNAAMNLAENGLEEAMYSINKKVDDDTYDWSGWTTDGTNAWRKWTGYTFDQNATGTMNVYVYNYLGAAAPKAVARSTITLGGGSARPIEKWVEVQLRKTSKFANGLVAKNSIIFNGNNVTVDSWNSDPDNDGLSPIPYSTAVRDDNGSVGSVSVSVDSVAVQNGDVWGYVSTGGDDPTDNVGASGSILGADSPAGVKVDPARVATDFTASFDPVAAPGGTYLGVPTGFISDNLTLPIPGDVPAADGKFYYTANQINFNNKELKITGKVVLKLTNTITAIDMAGGSSVINITSTGSLAVYAEGDIKIAGQGLSNGTDGADSGTDISDSESGQPVKFQLWGTKTSGVQNIDVKGNGTFSGVIYAPQGNVTVTGNGSISGSVVANDIKLTGNAAFHYDESLGNFGGGNPFRVSKWKELTTAADRAAYGTVLNF